MKAALIILGLLCALVLGGSSCGYGAWQYSKIGATDRFSQYGSFGRGIGASLDRRYEQRAYVGFGVGGFFTFIGLAMVGASLFIKKKEAPAQAGWQQPPQGWQQPPQQPQQGGWQQPPQGQPPMGGQSGPYG